MVKEEYCRLKDFNLYNTELNIIKTSLLGMPIFIFIYQ